MSRGSSSEVGRDIGQVPYFLQNGPGGVPRGVDGAVSGREALAMSLPVSVLRRTSVIAVSAALLALSGCGGDDGKKASSDPTTGGSATASSAGTPTGTASTSGPDAAA